MIERIDPQQRYIKVVASEQKLYLLEDDKVLRSYLVSTAKKGLGALKDSFQTPPGWHFICEKIGENAAIGTVFKYRLPTGEVYSDELAKQQGNYNFIITRILRLEGLEGGVNLGEGCDSKRRCIYIHGVPKEKHANAPSSNGCIDMLSEDIVELFDLVEVGTRVFVM